MTQGLGCTGPQEADPRHVPGLLCPGGMDGGQDDEGDHDEDNVEFLPHGFPSLPDAFQQWLSTIHMQPNHG